MSNKAGQFSRFLSEQICLLKNRTIMSRCHVLDKLPADNRTYFLESKRANEAATAQNRTKADVALSLNQLFTWN